MVGCREHLKRIRQTGELSSLVPSEMSYVITVQNRTRATLGKLTKRKTTFWMSCLRTIFCPITKRQHTGSLAIPEKRKTQVLFLAELSRCLLKNPKPENLPAT